MTFELTPPAQEPYRISPAATSPRSPNRAAYVQPVSGITVYCSATPVRTAFGIRMTRAKSSKARVVPIPNMMSWTSGTTARFVSKPPHEISASGKDMAQAANARTQTAKASLRWRCEPRAAAARNASPIVRAAPAGRLIPVTWKASAAARAVPPSASSNGAAAVFRNPLNRPALARPDRALPSNRGCRPANSRCARGGRGRSPAMARRSRYGFKPAAGAGMPGLPAEGTRARRAPGGGRGRKRAGSARTRPVHSRSPAPATSACRISSSCSGELAGIGALGKPPSRP